MMMLLYAFKVKKYAHNDFLAMVIAQSVIHTVRFWAVPLI